MTRRMWILNMAIDALYDVYHATPVADVFGRQLTMARIRTLQHREAACVRRLAHQRFGWLDDLAWRIEKDMAALRKKYGAREV